MNVDHEILMFRESLFASEIMLHLQCSPWIAYIEIENLMQLSIWWWWWRAEWWTDYWAYANVSSLWSVLKANRGGSRRTELAHLFPRHPFIQLFLLSWLHKKTIGGTGYFWSGLFVDDNHSLTCEFQCTTFSFPFVRPSSPTSKWPWDLFYPVFFFLCHYLADANLSSPTGSSSRWISGR